MLGSARNTGTRAKPMRALVRNRSRDRQYKVNRPNPGTEPSASSPSAAHCTENRKGGHDNKPRGSQPLNIVRRKGVRGGEALRGGHDNKRKKHVPGLFVKLDSIAFVVTCKNLVCSKRSDRGNRGQKRPPRPFVTLKSPLSESHRCEIQSDTAGDGQPREPQSAQTCTTSNPGSSGTRLL